MSCLIKHHVMNTCWESGVTAPRILNLENKWKSLVSFTLRLFYSHGKIIKKIGYLYRFLHIYIILDEVS
jgi:hypothetical protein